MPLELRPEHHGPHGSAHGGVLFTLAYQSAGAAAYARAARRDDGNADETWRRRGRSSLGLLSSATLAAVAQEFQIQEHLLSCPAEMALVERVGGEDAL